jgi:hypothetical protein
MDEQLFKGVKPEKDKLRFFFIYLEILNTLVDILSFNALKIEEDQIQQNFHIFFFFLINFLQIRIGLICAWTNKSIIKIFFEHMILFTINFLQNVWDKIFLALIALKINTKSLELIDKYKELESKWIWKRNWVLKISLYF